MVRLFRGPIRGRGRGVPRPALGGPRHMVSHDFQPEHLPYGFPRPRSFMPRGISVRPGPPLQTHRIGPPPLPQRHMPLSQRHQPLPPYPRGRPFPITVTREPPPHSLNIQGQNRGIGIGLPPPMLSGPPIRRPMRLLRPVGFPRGRGRGFPFRKGVELKGPGFSANGLGRFKKNQKPKERSEGDFYCETCDRGFKTAEKLEDHQSEHQVCGRDGCVFTAHPKLIQQHVQIQHESGLYHKIVSTENPDDIAKWIAERKRRFPTKINVEKKHAEHEEMMSRGERIPSQGKPFQNKQNRFNGRERRPRRNKSHVDGETEPKQEKQSVKASKSRCDRVTLRDPEAWRGNLPQFPGTAAFPYEEEVSVEESKEESRFSDDEEWTKDTPTAAVIEKPLVSNILASLMLNYGSDMTDDDDDIEPTTQITKPSVTCAKKQETSSQEQKVESSTTETSKGVEELAVPEKEDSDSGPEEVAVKREDSLNVPIPESEPRRRIEVTKSVLCVKNIPIPTQRPLKRHQLSLLEKLLRNEVRHERNVILQCVRYVVNNNFLGCGNNAPNTTAFS